MNGTKLTRRLRSLLVTAVLGVVPSCFAAPTASITLTGVGTSGVLGGFYIGPYVGTVDTVTTPLICDDFLDDSYIPESWTANVYGLADYAQARFGTGVPSAAILSKYEEVAWLSQQLTYQSLGLSTFLPCPSGVNCAGDIQFAIWSIFDPPALGSIGGANLTNTNLWLTAAAAQYSTGDYSNVTFYTPLVDAGHPVMCGDGPCPKSPPQELVVVRTPEPPSLAVLGVDVSAVGALIFFLRRKIRTT